MLSHPITGSFIRQALHKVFSEGYSFQDPQYVGGKPSVEIFIRNMDDKKSLLFDAAMRVMKIEFSYPCGLTREITGEFRVAIRELKQLLIDASGLEPEEDTNHSVAD